MAIDPDVQAELDTDRARLTSLEENLAVVAGRVADLEDVAVEPPPHVDPEPPHVDPPLVDPLPPLLDAQIPDADNPVGPTNWAALRDEPTRVRFNDGGNHVMESVRYLDGFVISNGTSVTLRNCHVISPGSFITIRVVDGFLVMEDSQIGDDTTAAGERGVSGNNVTLRRVKIVGHTDGIKAGHNSLYEQVWVTDLRDAGPGHMDALQDEGAGGWVVRYSRLEGITLAGELGNAAAIIKSDLGSIDDVTLESNYLDGGNWILMVDPGSNYPAPTNVRILNNAFGRNFRGGPLLRDDAAGITWEGNVWADTGESLLLDDHGGGSEPVPEPPHDH